MKKFLIYFSGLFLCVILFALVCDKANMWLIHNSSGNGISKMERLWQMSHRDEVPILGSSRALGNYVPSLIADNCFNYGVNGMGMDELLFNLKAIRETNSPHPVILNIDPWATLSENKSSWVGDYRLAPQSGRRGGGIQFLA